MRRWRNALVVVLIWAGIYLPGLGALEIKGEEGRRILPGLAMIATGDWLVPHIAGEPYLRKPPLVNWAAAVAVLCAGRVDEGVVRLPSVLAVLGAALLLLAGTTRRHGATTGLVCALFFLTTLALMEKGRLIEIEAIYVAATAAAFALWLGWCAPRTEQSAGPVRPAAWLGVGVFLGIGLLAKGPLHLLYFYGPICAVLAVRGRWRDLYHPAHFCGMALAGAVFAAWAIPYFDATRSLDTSGVWAAQVTGRLSGGRFEIGQWLLNFPRGVVNFLPWVVFLPLAFGHIPNARADADARELRFLAWSVILLYAVVMLIPESAPRYTLPVLPSACLVFALSAAGCGERWRRVWSGTVRVFASLGLAGLVAGCGLAVFGGWVSGWIALAGAAIAVLWLLIQRPGLEPDGLAFRSGVVMVMGTLLYVGMAQPRMRLHETDRRDGRTIAGAIESGSLLTAVDLGFQPFEFYLPGPIRHVPKISAIPADARYVLCRSDRSGSLRPNARGVSPEERVRIRRPDGREWVLFEWVPPGRDR